MASPMFSKLLVCLIFTLHHHEEFLNVHGAGRSQYFYLQHKCVLAHDSCVPAGPSAICSHLLCAMRCLREDTCVAYSHLAPRCSCHLCPMHVLESLLLQPGGVVGYAQARGKSAVPENTATLSSSSPQTSMMSEPQSTGMFVSSPRTSMMSQLCPEGFTSISGGCVETGCYSLDYDFFGLGSVGQGSWPAGYDGEVCVTTQGVICQRWTLDTPHARAPRLRQYLSSMPRHSWDHNFCRLFEDPNVRNIKPWCYTTDPDKRWDYCDIPHCRGS